MIRQTLLVAAAACLIAAPAAAQMPAGPPGKAEASRVTAGSYKIDPNHTQILWEVDHLGFTPLRGLFGNLSGTLTIDPANLAAAKVDVDIPMTGLTVSSAPFGEHLKTPDLFDVAQFPAAKFVSTSVKASGNMAVITGNLTIKGVTKPVTLEAQLYGAGASPMSKKLNVGFTATTSFKRSDFGLGLVAPIVSDKVDLKITAAFEKEG